MRLSIVFPAYNEELNIRPAVEEALSYLQGRQDEVVAVNDGSLDRTGSILDDLAKEHPGRVRAIHHSMNQGYSATLRDGFLAAQGEWVFYTDSDRQFVLRELDRLLAVSDGADLVIGFRKDRQDPWRRRFAAKCYNLLVRLLFGLRGVSDIDCAFKLFRRDVFDKFRIRSSDFLIDTEILVKSHDLGLVIREVPVTHRLRPCGVSTVRFKHVMTTLYGLALLFKEVRLSKAS